MKGLRTQTISRSLPDPTNKFISTAVKTGINNPGKDTAFHYDSSHNDDTVLPITINIPVDVTLKTLPKNLFLINLSQEKTCFKIHRKWIFDEECHL